ncbi:MAG: GNAT family N-acetyltransferase [Actinomycetota bacterium]
MAVRALTTDDVAQYREIRLEALRHDPDAFGSTYEREMAFDDGDWRARLTDTPHGPFTMFADDVDGRLVAIAGIGVTRWDPRPMLVAMWVRPEARGTGAGRRLVGAALDWATARGESEVVLWVVRGNTPAINLYAACGFVASGQTDTLPSNPCAEELEMRYTLG